VKYAKATCLNLNACAFKEGKSLCCQSEQSVRWQHEQALDPSAGNVGDPCCTYGCTEPHYLNQVAHRVLGEGLTRGGIIEALLKLQVLLLRAPKRCFCLSKIFAAVWCSLLVPHFIILAHFLAMWASYICSPHPKGIPLVSSTIDVLLGRSIKFSDDAASPHANSIVSINLFKRQSIVEHHESHTQIGHEGKCS